MFNPFKGTNNHIVDYNLLLFMVSLCYSRNYYGHFPLVIIENKFREMLRPGIRFCL